MTLTRADKIRIQEAKDAIVHSALDLFWQTSILISLGAYHKYGEGEIDEQIVSLSVFVNHFLDLEKELGINDSETLEMAYKKIQGLIEKKGGSPDG